MLGKMFKEKDMNLKKSDKQTRRIENWRIYTNIHMKKMTGTQH